MRGRQEHRRINKLLASHGLGRLEDGAGLVAQLAFLVKDHEHFRQLLEASEPAERVSMYDAMTPSLRFPALPLDVYMAETRAIAERKQLPTLEADGSIRPFHPAEIGTAPTVERVYGENGGQDAIYVKLHPSDPRQQFRVGVEDAAQVTDEEAITHCREYGTKLEAEQKANANLLAEANEIAAAALAPKHLEVVCGRCTKRAAFHGNFKDDCVRAARAAGWRYDPANYQEVCPECS
jgi:hypothetical protein